MGRRGRGLVLAVNKWDLVKKDPERKRILDESIKRQLKFVPFAPKINLSALTGERVKKLFEKINEVHGQFCQRISTGTVNRAIEEMVQRRPPPRTGRGGRLKFFYATQTGVRPPTFVVFVNMPQMVHFSYRRFMMLSFLVLKSTLTDSLQTSTGCPAFMACVFTLI